MRNISSFAVAALAVVAVAGCAKAPETIEPSYTSPMAYESYSCRQLAAETQRVESALEAKARQQEDTRTNDTLGLLAPGLHMPVASMTGADATEEIADLKGKREALDAASESRDCRR